MVAVFAVIPVLSAVMYDFAFEPTAAFFSFGIIYYVVSYEN